MWTMVMLAAGVLTSVSGFNDEARCRAAVTKMKKKEAMKAVSFFCIDSRKSCDLVKNDEIVCRDRY